MAHIPYARQIVVTPYARLMNVRPRNTAISNFAVFCGSEEQRYITGLHTLSDYAGEIGIVVLHNNPRFVSALQNHPAISNHPSLMINVVNKNYDPLYGMTKDSVASLIVTKSSNYNFTTETNELYTGLLAYLDIMDYQFRTNPKPFGAYPYNLDLLYQMTAMPYDQLEKSIIRFLPDHIRYSIESILDKSVVQAKVHAAVRRFASNLEDHIWTYRGLGGHTGVSIIDSVKNRKIISIKVTDSNSDILDYINSELSVLALENIPVLIVSCDINLKKCEALQRRFIEDDTHANTYTGIISDSTSLVSENQTDISKLFIRYPQIFIFRCGSNTQGEVFSVEFGNYWRTEITQGRHVDWQPFKIFPAKGVAHHKEFKEERNIRPDEFTKLGNGVVLCGNAYGLPEIINNFDLRGEPNNGFLLP